MGDVVISEMGIEGEGASEDANKTEGPNMEGIFSRSTKS